MKNQTYFGAIALVVSGIICKVLGALFRIPLTNILSVEGIGYFQMAMALYSFALVFISGGISVVLSKMVSESLATKNKRKVNALFSYAAIYVLIVSFLVGGLFAIFSTSLSKVQGFDGVDTYLLFWLLLLVGGLVATFRGYFQGHQNMYPTAISQIIEQTFKFVLGIVFAYYLAKISISLGVLGAFLGILAGEIFAFFFLYITYLVKYKTRDYNLYTRQHIKRNFNSANIKIAFSSSVFPLVHAIDAVLIVPLMMFAGFSAENSSALFGLQTGVVGAILNLPLVLSFAITSALLPNISQKLKKNDENVNKNATNSLNILLFLIFPTTFGLFAISPILYKLIYPGLSNALCQTAIYLTLYGVTNIIFMAIMQFFFMLLEAKGLFGYVLMCSLIGGILKISFLLFAMFPQVNIFAIPIGNIVMSFVAMIIALLKVRKVYQLKVSPIKTLVMILSALVMCSFVYQICVYSQFSRIVTLFLAVLIGIFIYFLLALPCFFWYKK